MKIPGSTYVRNITVGLLALAPMVTGMAATPVPDSLLSVEQAYAYNLTEYHKSLQIVRTMQQRRMAPEWKLQMVEGDIYANVRMINHALRAYQQALSSPAIADSAQIQLQLQRNCLYCYDIVGNEKEVLQTNYRLFDMANKYNSLPYKSIAHFMWGKRTFFSESNENIDSYKECLDAIQMMKQSDYRYKNQELQTFYGHLAQMYMTDGRYDEALRCSQEQERIVRKRSLTDIRHKDYLLLYRTLVFRCYLLAKMGRLAEADSCYSASQRMVFYDALADRYSVLYLQAARRYPEMLQVVRRVKALVREDGDSVSAIMAQLLREEATALEGLGDYKSSVESYKQMAQVLASVRRETAAVMASSVQEAIENEKAISHRNMQLVIVAVVVFLLIGLVVALIIHDRLVHHRNALMVSTMRRLEFYRDRAAGSVKENPDETGENEVALTEEEVLQQRFLEVDNEITKNRLFCRPDFGRDDLIRMMGVDKNTLPGLISRFTGTNVVWYINSKRMDYAASLMKEHPEYTFSAIAEACGIKSPATFIRNFKTTFGMSPSDYRKTLEITPPQPNN